MKLDFSYHHRNVFIGPRFWRIDFDIGPGSGINVESQIVEALAREMAEEIDREILRNLNA